MFSYVTVFVFCFFYSLVTSNTTATADGEILPETSKMIVLTRKMLTESGNLTIS